MSFFNFSRQSNALEYLRFQAIPNRKYPPMIVELKYDKAVKSAIVQINDREYRRFFQGYKRVILAAVNYDKANKTHQCLIEKHIFD